MCHKSPTDSHRTLSALMSHLSISSSNIRDCWRHQLFAADLVETPLELSHTSDGFREVKLIFHRDKSVKKGFKIICQMHSKWGNLPGLSITLKLERAVPACAHGESRIVPTCNESALCYRRRLVSLCSKLGLDTCKSIWNIHNFSPSLFIMLNGSPDFCFRGIKRARLQLQKWESSHFSHRHIQKLGLIEIRNIVICNFLTEKNSFQLLAGSTSLQDPGRRSGAPFVSGINNARAANWRSLVARNLSWFTLAVLSIAADSTYFEKNMVFNHCYCVSFAVWRRQ